MKRFWLFLSLASALTGYAMAASPDRTPALQVQVDVPASVDPLHEDDVVEVFVNSVSDAFRRRGFDGNIEDLSRTDRPREGVPLITVRLIRWEQTRTGGVDITFAASVTPAGGKEQSLGSFNHHELGTAITNRWSLAEAFRDAAERAAEQMWRRLAEMNVIPGISKEKRKK